VLHHLTRVQISNLGDATSVSGLVLCTALILNGRLAWRAISLRAMFDVGYFPPNTPPPE
jgi:hypothetical protein